MTEIVREQVPEGFELIPEGLGYTDTLQPCYRKLEGSEVSFGLIVESQHGNSMGICHGGVLMTLADIAAASGLNMARGVRAGSPTINLSVDFIASAKRGQWIQADIEGTSIKRRFGFSRGVISTSRGVVARFSGTFYFPDHEGMWQNGKPVEGALSGIDG